MTNNIHVYPLNDIVPHITEGENCPCCPEIIQEANGKIVVHNSWDGREEVEEPKNETWVL